MFPVCTSAPPNMPMHLLGAAVLREALICEVPSTKLRVSTGVIPSGAFAGDGQIC